MADRLAGDVLTRQAATVEVLTGTHLIGPQMVAAGRVARVHPLPTDAAQKQALQQGRTFPRCASPVVRRRTRGVLSQTGQVSFVLFPNQISRMRILDEHLPLVQRQAPDHSALPIG
jgi:hypothetical protein